MSATMLAGKRANVIGWALVAPALLVLFAVGAYPLFRTFYLSLTNTYLGSGADPKLVGLRNYALLFTDGEFWTALAHTIAFTVISVSLEFAFGLGCALLLQLKFRGRGAIRASMLIPWAIPTVVAARIWGYMLVDTYGVVNDVLFTRLHLLPEKVAWLAQPILSFAAIIAVDVWKTTPFVALLLLAGLQTIPRQMYEAAEVDGATPWQRLRAITLPMLKPAILVALVFRTLDALRVFDVIWVLTRGELGTESLATYNFRYLVDFRKVGYGSAVSVVIFLTVAAFAAVYVYLLREKHDHAS